MHLMRETNCERNRCAPIRNWSESLVSFYRDVDTDRPAGLPATTQKAPKTKDRAPRKRTLRIMLPTKRDRFGIPEDVRDPSGEEGWVSLTYTPQARSAMMLDPSGATQAPPSLFLDTST